MVRGVRIPAKERSGGDYRAINAQNLTPSTVKYENRSPFPGYFVIKANLQNTSVHNPPNRSYTRAIFVIN